MNNSPFMQQLREMAAREAQKEVERHMHRRHDASDSALDLIGDPKEFDRYTDYYGILEVDEFSSASEIRKAYMRLSVMRQAH